MILAIRLATCDRISSDEEVLSGGIVYTSKIAEFEYESDALEFAKEQPEMMLIENTTGEIIKDASVEVL